MTNIYEPLVSVITVVYNGASTIEQTIQSVLNQTYKNIEYIIIDGASTDGTQDIIGKYMDSIAYFASESDNGIYDAMNKGIKRASGDLIGIINSDDWYEPEAVKEAVRCLEDTGADVVYGEIWIIGAGEQREYHTSHSAFPPHPSTFIRSSAYEKYGLFDTGYQIAADRELLLRFMANGARFEHIDKILTDFRVTGISNSQDMVCADETYKVNLKYLGKCPQHILNRESIEEKYSRDKLLYISDRKPIAIRDILGRYCHDLDNIVIFGAGACGKEFGDILEKCGVSFCFFTDNDEKKWGLEWHGNKIFSPEILRHGSFHVIMTSSAYQQEIRRQLLGYSNLDMTWSGLDEIREKVIKHCDSLFEGLNF